MCTESSIQAVELYEERFAGLADRRNSKRGLQQLMPVSLLLHTGHKAMRFSDTATLRM